MNEVEPYSQLAGVYDEIVVDPCFPLWADFLDTLWRSDAEGIASVLDVCCGTGLMYAELQRRGYQVTGIDASAAMLERARGLLGADAELAVEVLPDLRVEGPFDAAISTFDGLNYLPPTAFAQSLAAIASRLRPSGWLVFDLHTDAMLELAAARPVITGETDGNAFTITNDVDLSARTCSSRIEVTRAGDTFAEVHTQYFHADDEVRSALAAAGCSLLRVVDEYTDVRASETTVRGTWICQRHA